jgi:exodeoxyribonuclease VII large subunit
LREDPAQVAIGVSELTEIAREIVEGAFVPLWVRGEVCDFKAHRSGHWYFCLRDDASQVRCVVWRTDQRRIPAPPDDGMQVLAFGQLTVYPARGEMQLAVAKLATEGDGLWRKAMELALARLRSDGLLDLERKRPLARFPRRVAVVTSPDGAALRDIIAVARRRCPSVEIVLVPAKVQGDGAVEELVDAIERVSRWCDCDTLIVGRGGGARDDLWAFNDERVARALAACTVPTISAVGHEVDVTLCDLVADVRAPTPSAAAEAAVPVVSEMRDALRAYATALRSAMERSLLDSRSRVAHVARDVARAAQHHAERRRAELETLSARLNALSPLATLGRGYTVARDANGHTLSRVADFAVNEPFTLLVRDGAIGAVTKKVGRSSPEHPEHPPHP